MSTEQNTSSEIRNTAPDTDPDIGRDADADTAARSGRAGHRRLGGRGPAAALGHPRHTPTSTPWAARWSRPCTRWTTWRRCCTGRSPATRDQQQAGRLVYDDTREVDPAERLQVAAVALTELRSKPPAAEFWANAFWSAIGHIGVEGPPTGHLSGGLQASASCDDGEVTS